MKSMGQTQIYGTKTIMKSPESRRKWSERQDLNLRPLAPQTYQRGEEKPLVTNGCNNPTVPYKSILTRSNGAETPDNDAFFGTDKCPYCSRLLEYMGNGEWGCVRCNDI